MSCRFSRFARALMVVLAASIVVTASAAQHEVSNRVSSPGVPAVTFSKDIAPILFARCAVCHNPDGPAPFSVITYSPVKQRARLIASAPKDGTRFRPAVFETHTDEEMDILEKCVGRRSPFVTDQRK